MENNGTGNYFYLNQDNHWLSFDLRGLERRPDGSLQLLSVPLLEGALPGEVAALSGPDGPAGIAVGPDNTLYFSHPAGHRLLMIDACDSELKPLPCLGGEGEQLTQLKCPRGVLYHPTRPGIFVADSGNHRIQVFDPGTFQLLDVWGQPDPSAEPQAGDEPGRLNTPWSLSSDAEGNVYVVDYGNQRVQKFDVLGNPLPGFWATAQAESTIRQPTDTAVAGQGNVTEIYVLDAGQAQIYVFDPAGHFLCAFGSKHLSEPMGIVVAAGAVYVGDNQRRRVLKFFVDGSFVGAARGYEGPVAALAVDHQDGLWLHSGSDLVPLRLGLGQAHVKGGVLWGGPFGSGARRVRWHRLKALTEPLAADARLQFFVYASDDDYGPPPEPADPAATEPFDTSVWCPMPAGVVDGLIRGRQSEGIAQECAIPGSPARYVWVGAHFTGAGLQSPALSQIRISFDHQTYTQHLPAIYRRYSPQREMLERFLALFESLNGDIEDRIAGLARLFDPETAPAEWLSWLAGWLALDLDENWPEAKKREAIARAWTMHSWRGTAEGLRGALRFFAGIDAHIDEPLLHAAWWMLPEDESSPPLETRNSVLGFSTMLVGAEEQGAVVGTTAVLDQSHVITGEEFGRPLFEDIAHQFTVHVFRGQVRSQKKLDEVHALLEREKPAHTAYHLCLVEPYMRVGFQARVGIDTVVAGPPEALRLSQETRTPAALGGVPAGNIGEDSQVGISTRVY